MRFNNVLINKYVVMTTYLLHLDSNYVEISTILDQLDLMKLIYKKHVDIKMHFSILLNLAQLTWHKFIYISQKMVQFNSLVHQ